MNDTGAVKAPTSPCVVPMLESNIIAIAKAKSMAQTVEIFNDETDNDSTVTTECADGPGCLPPWMKSKSDECKEECACDEATPKAKNVRKPMKTKRIVKAAKRASNAAPKRKYTKKAARFYAKSDDTVKITSQNISDTTNIEMQNNLHQAFEIAPPFASAAIPVQAYRPIPYPEAMSTRRQQLLRYWKKKFSVKKARHCYKARQQVAEKRLRIEGRFVTKKQAYEILGMEEEDLLSHKAIQELLIKHVEEKKITSHIQAEKSGGHIFKVQNFQALIRNTWNHTADKALKGVRESDTKEEAKPQISSD